MVSWNSNTKTAHNSSALVCGVSRSPPNPTLSPPLLVLVYVRACTSQEVTILPSGGVGTAVSEAPKPSLEQQQQLEQQPKGSDGSSNMSRLSAKVDSDRASGGMPTTVFTGYLKACGTVAVSVALAISVFSQVRGCLVRRRGMFVGSFFGLAL